MSRLYRNLGWAGGPLFEVTLDEEMTLGDDHLMSISTHRGSSDPSTHTPSTAHVHAARRVELTSRSLSIRLTSAAASFLATRGYTTAAAIRDRFQGRRGATTAHDTARLGWRTTELMAASWDSALLTSPDTWTPMPGYSYSGAITSDALNPEWSPASTTWSGGSTDRFYDAGDPMTARQILAFMESRLMLFTGERSGRLVLHTLPTWQRNAASAALSTWPLSRSHVLAPTTWHQPNSARREYELRYRAPAGGIVTIVTAEGGIPTGTVLLNQVDWTDSVAHTTHWRRIYGVNISSNHLTSWSVPRVTARLDHLLGSRHENDRRAAGMLLALEVGDPLPLAGDWPDQLAGIVYVNSISEQITPAGWTMTLGLTPTRWIDGATPLLARPRTWNQTRMAWDDPTTETWNEGLPA